MAITDKERAINRNVLRNRCALVLVVGVGQNKRDHLLIQYAMILAAFSSHDVSHPRFGVFPTRKAPRFASEPGRLPNSPPPELLLLNIESEPERENGDRKSTRLNSSHEWISYAVFCLKKKKNKKTKKIRNTKHNK